MLLLSPWGSVFGLLVVRVGWWWWGSAGVCDVNVSVGVFVVWTRDVGDQERRHCKKSS